MNGAAFLLALSLACGVADESPAPVVLLPAEPTPLALRVEIDSTEPAAAWNAFLDAWFAFFDRDGNGSLSAEEAARLFPLPLPGGELAFPFAELDVDRDRRATREELTSYARSHGFAPVALRLLPASDDDLQLGALFAASFDIDHNGLIDNAELQRTSAALRRFDANDDEYLGRDELLRGSVAGTEALPPVEAGKATPAGTLRVAFGPQGAVLLAGELPNLTIRSLAARPQVERLEGPGWSAIISLRLSTASAGSARGFLTAQFQAALADRAALPLAELDQEPALSGLTELAAHADRNGDQALSLAELESFFKLVGLGLNAQTWMSVMDRGRNLFPALDADGDDRLSPQELAAAGEMLACEAPLPRQLWISFSGVQTESWGGAPIPTVRARVAAQTPAADAPAWFRALDRNGDGMVSEREFLGPAEKFRALDANQDQLVDPREADASHDATGS